MFWGDKLAPELGHETRENKVLESLRLDHLNSEEREVMENTCRDYQDIFYRPGDKLSCTNAAKHSMNLVRHPSTENRTGYPSPKERK